MLAGEFVESYKDIKKFNKIEGLYFVTLLPLPSILTTIHVSRSKESSASNFFTYSNLDNAIPALYRTNW